MHIDIDFSENTRMIMKTDRETVDSVLLAECIIAKIKREMATNNNVTLLNHILNLRNKENMVFSGDILKKFFDFLNFKLKKKTAFQLAAHFNQIKLLELLFTYVQESYDQVDFEILFLKLRFFYFSPFSGLHLFHFFNRVQEGLV